MVRFVELTLCLSLVLGIGTAQPQQPAVLAGCTTKNAQPTCDWYWFRKTLDSAHSVKVKYDPMDRSTGAQLEDLAKTLGKSVAANGETPDLTFTIAPAPTTGIDIGPGDEEILELKVYSDASAPQKLIWVETYRGQKDRPWPANVHAAIEQFRKKVEKSRTPAKG